MSCHIRLWHDFTINVIVTKTKKNKTQQEQRKILILLLKAYSMLYCIDSTISVVVGTRLRSAVRPNVC